MNDSHGSVARALRWWRAPWWALAIVTGAKSFWDNPILGAARHRGRLHTWRKRTAHRLAERRRARIAPELSPDLRAAFDRDGFVMVRDFLPRADFARLQADLLDSAFDTRAHQQGDTITRRVAVTHRQLRRFPALDALLGDPRWNAIMHYVGATRAAPLYYIQTIVGGVDSSLPDPQVHLHSDTFHPSLKAWLFLTDVADDGRPLTYVAGSHRLTPEREAWERNKVDRIDIADRLSQRGSLRVETEELEGLGLPQATRFAVPANTLVAIDTCGFHARADADHPTLRVEIWAYNRRTPFLPWAGGHLASWRPIAIRRAGWLLRAVDLLARSGLMIQHWKPDGQRRPRDR